MDAITKNQIISEFEKEREKKFKSAKYIPDNSILQNLAEKHNLEFYEVFTIVENHYTEKNRPDMKYKNPKIGKFIH